MAGVLLEARPYRPFKSSEEYLYAMKEDLAEWLNMLYSELELNVDNFMDKLETGVVLCKHANSIKKSAEEYVARKQLRKMTSSQSLTASLMTKTALPITRMGEVVYRLSAKPGTFFARDNVSNFIDFCRHGLEIIECLLFETDDLIMRKNEKNVILCLLEVARRGAKFGMLAPILVQMEREIDREIAAEQRLARGDADEESSEDEEELVQYGPIPQIVTNDLKSLDEMVRDLVEKCTCPTQFPMIRVSEGKYRIGDTKVLIFVRILRSHVMVRVGGGWDTLSHYLDKHDPCRCRTGHRAALSSKLILKNTGAIELNNAQVHYERSPPRTRRSSASSSSSGHGGRDTRDLLSTYPNYTSRSRSPTPKRDNAKGNLHPQKYISTYLYEEPPRQGSASPNRGRSVSPGGSIRPSYDAPTMASRNRSRSPSVRSPEPQKKFNSEVLAHVKQNEVKYSTTTELNEPEVEKSRRAKVTLEANEASSNNDEGKHNDSGSEVSDEGYRSLGLIVTTPLIGEGKVVANGMKRQKQNSLIESSSLRESPTSECSFESNDQENQFPSVDDLKVKRDRKSTSRERSVSTTKTTVKNNSPAKKISHVSSRGSSPIRNSESPIRRHSHMNESESYRRKSNKENETRKAPRSRSATSGRTSSGDVCLAPKHVKSGLEADKFGTWNGKSKRRSGLHSDGYSSSFVRNGVGRSSLGAHGTHNTTYDPVTGRRVYKGKEQKNMSPLLADLLKTKNLDDDKTILRKMKEIINQYSGIFEDASDKKFDSEAEELDFTSEWVRNNGSIKRMESGDFADEKSSPNKRKDSKYDGTHSKIPAPVFFKHHISEKEC